MARVVLDTNVIVSACLTPEGAAATIVELALLGTLTCASRLTCFLNTAKFSPALSFRASKNASKILLDGIADVAVMVAPKHTISISQDYEDNRLLECAVAAQADFLVTGNLKHFPDAFENIRIATPRDFLVELGY